MSLAKNVLAPLGLTAAVCNRWKYSKKDTWFES